MAQLVDTSILGRLADLTDPLHLMVNRALAALHQQGEVLHITPQNLIFNTKDFARFSGFGPGNTVVDPATV